MISLFPFVDALSSAAWSVERPGLLAEILSDESLRRAEFPATADRTFLAHAAVCPPPARVVSAMVEYARRIGRTGQFEHHHRAAEDAVRRLAAELVGASADEIALVPSTSAGLAAVAAGLDWEPGDNVVLAPGDFPGNVYPWLALAHRGVKVKWLGREAGAGITASDVADAVDGRTRLVSLSSVHYCTGMPADLDAIGRHLRARGVLFCVDAIQSLGAVPTSTRHVDFLCADAHKWLLGPQGIGVLFVRRENFRRLRPALAGWRSVREPTRFTQTSQEYSDTARRYEPGSLNAVGVVGLAAALELITEVGVPAISARLAALRGRLVAGLRGQGCRVLGRPAPAPITGITAFVPPHGRTAELHRRLDRLRIITSLREESPDHPCIRVAPHFYNTDSEIDLLLEQI